MALGTINDRLAATAAELDRLAALTPQIDRLAAEQRDAEKARAVFRVEDVFLRVAADTDSNPGMALRIVVYRRCE